MKNLFYLSILTLFIQCKFEKNTETGIIEYMKWDNDTNYNFREYQSITDSSITKIFITQRWESINDSTWEFEYLWTNIDSLPINKSVERYTENMVEVMGQYIYEIDSLGNSVELPIDFGNSAKWPISEEVSSINASVHFKLDTAVSMYVQNNLMYEYKLIDTMPQNEQDCLVITYSDKTSFVFSDARKDTIINTVGKRIYAKGLGLIYFSDDIGTQKIEYKLIK